MKERERPHDDPQQPLAAAPSDGDGLDAQTRRAAAFHAAGDAAIERALSADSADFLRANRQHGGQ